MSFFRVWAKPDRSPPVSVEFVRSELDKVLASGRFAASDRQRRFLQFVVEESLEGRESGIKESVLALEVFGRGASFDPRTDSVVRSEARNLRARLNEYYMGEGRTDQLVIDLPKGSYVPVFRALTAAPRRRLPSARTLALASGLAALICGFAWWFFGLRPAMHGAGGQRSIAVLPFLNLTGNSDKDYVTDGLVEDLTTELARLPGLRVAARTSAFQFRGKSADIRKIGRDLGVAAVLEGSVREEAGRIKVTAQLIDAENGYHLWSETFEREASGIQAVESDILSGVSETLAVKRAARAASPHLPPPEAREAYWRGRYLKANNWLRAGAESVPYFERAVALDPKFAEAWAALASTHANMAFHQEGPVEEEVAKARNAAQRALELDETIPEAHLALAGNSYSFHHDWPAAERAYRRALELNASHAPGHRGFALALMSQGRFDEALDHLKVAQQLDPISILTTNNMATTLYCARRYEEAIGVARRHLEMDPQFFPALSIIGLCEAQRGRFAEAISDYEKAKSQGGEGSLMVIGPLGNALAHAGRPAEARAILAELEKIQKTDGIPGTAPAMVYAGLGEKSRAVEFLRQAADAHVTDVTFIGVDPVFDPLRGEPEFQALCARLGIPNIGAAHTRGQ